MIPSLQQLSIETKLKPKDLNDRTSRRQNILTQLSRSQILYAIQTDSETDAPGASEAGWIDSGLEKLVKEDIMAVKKMGGGGLPQNTGTYNTGVIVPSMPAWFDIKTYRPMSRKFARKFYFVENKVSTNGMFYRWTRDHGRDVNNMSTNRLERQRVRLMREAYLMLTAAYKGFGPSIYAIYIQMLNIVDLKEKEKPISRAFYSLFVAMDNGTWTLQEYVLNTLLLTELTVDGFVADLTTKCRRASDAGFFLLDIKPSNIVCGTYPNGGLNIMFIDFDPRWTFELTKDEASCIEYLNLFLLALHIKCNLYGVGNTGVVRALLKQIVQKMSKVEIESFGTMVMVDGVQQWRGKSITPLCSVIKQIELTYRAARIDENSGVLEEHQIEIDFPRDSRTQYRPKYATLALKFCTIIQSYFTGSKCNDRFDFVLDDETRLHDQLYEWLIEENPSIPVRKYAAFDDSGNSDGEW